LPRVASARVKSLRAKRNGILRALRVLDREIARTERALGVRRRRAVPTRKPNARRMNELTVKDAVVKVLRSRKRPMHYKDITETLLRERIYRTRSKNFLSTVAISIMRDKRLKRVEPGVYTLRKGA
jgi:hypothetical protein